MKKLTRESIQPIVDKFAKILHCNCDLDNWQPDARTGHSWVCCIHKAAIAEWKQIGANDV